MGNHGSTKNQKQIHRRTSQRDMPAFVQDHRQDTQAKSKKQVESTAAQSGA